MKISRQWIHEDFVDLSHISNEEFINQLRSLGHAVSLVTEDNGTILDITPSHNRPDCHSIIGIARESASAFGIPRKFHTPNVIEQNVGSIYELLDVDVWTEQCNRFSVRMAVNVKIAPSPDWLRNRLRHCGISPVNNMIDITNYVSLEYDQPFLAIDLSSITSSSIVVRDPFDGEGDDLILADGFPLLATLTENSYTNITESTTSIVFAAANLSDRSRDPMLTVPALQRLCELIQLLDCGDVLDGTIDILNYVPIPKTIPLNSIALPQDLLLKYLDIMEIPVEDDMVIIPSFRTDLHTAEDISQEIQKLRMLNICS